MGKRIKSSAERKSVPSSILDKALEKQPNARTLLIDGWVELNQGLKRQRRHLYLYSDLFIVAKTKRNHLKVKNTIKLTDMWTASYEDEMEKSNTNAMTSFVLGWPTVNYVATFSSEEQKEKWLSLLQRCINLEKEKDHPKSIPIKIFTEGFDNYTYYKTIAVRNSDTTTKVMNMSLPKLRINGSVRDYQLWVKSEKEAAPYPLIGHEYIYAIKMNHLRDTALLKQESKDGTTTSNLLEPFLMEDVPQKMHCQFILKPRHLTVPRPPSGWDTFRKSIRNWVCCQDSDTYIEDLPIPPRAGKTGQLFGIPLENIFEDNNPPKPILDMLHYLYKEGPKATGIFRKGASVKSCLEFKDQLNAGTTINLECQSIFVTASVFKEFLSDIPGSLLTSKLYSQWMSVMSKENEEEKINAIQRLLQKLPKANVILIKYLFGVLQNIEKHFFLNHMTSYNLSVCIGPSILRPSSSPNPEKEIDFIKEVLMLTQFMIEHAHCIFEEINSLWGEDSVSHHNGENAPGHEDHHQIKIKHLEDTATTSDMLEPFLMEEVAPKMQSPVIQKQSHLAVSQKTSGWDTFRKSIRNWVCCQDSDTYIEDLPIPPRAGKTGQLFGIPLENIFEDNNPPKPILDMLHYLYKEGPKATGIFRKGASVKSCLEFKDQLNAGTTINLECQSIFVTASVFKEFLSDIPGSLLTSKLYSQWMSVMSKENEEEKINAIQRLLQKLPKANVILIKYLFGVLQNIEKHFFLNHMTSYNLSVCIGPSILRPSSSPNPEKEIDFIKEVLMLTQFMIEHAHCIFEEINSLWGEDSVSHHNGENAPGHEDHHQIKIKHLEDTATTSDMLEPFLMEEVAPKMQSPVIQKQSHLAVSQKTSGLDQVALQERSSENQLCLRNNFIHPNQLNICQTSPLPGVLFLICILDIFENEDLPNFVLDVCSFINSRGRLLQANNSRMLSILNYFRQPRANQDSEVQECLDYRSLVLLACALRVFLRNTPNTIFPQISVKTGSLHSLKEI